MSTFIDPYPYQEQVAKNLLKGQSIVLQAPTGAGKTAAALLPFLHAQKNFPADQFPRKCIYSVPMKVLANQFEAEYKNIIRRYGWQDDLRVKVQTGDRPEDASFEGDLIFTTIDQTLSSFLNIPYGLGNRLANLNAGAIMSSYLVFDELHLYDPDTTLPTTLEMLKIFRGITPFIVMTATFSSSMLQELADLLGAVVVPDPEQPGERRAMESIGSQVGKDRRFYAEQGQLTADSILSHNVKRTICICNTVRSAQKLYDDLHDALRHRGDTETELHLLHSRFYKEDRQRKEEWIRDNFGVSQKKYTGKRLIQIATQVIEVGVDATCDVLHTELAPASSLLQRAGRCARRENEIGRVYIYLPRNEETGEPNFAPYFLEAKAKQTERGRLLCEATWTAVNTPQFTDIHMSFSQEQALIDAVHTPVDQAIMRELGHISYNRRDKILSTMRNPVEGRGSASELIRDVDNRFVFVHPHPDQDEKLLTNPWTYEGFGLYPGMIFRECKELLEQVDSDTPWMIRGAHPIKDGEGSARDEETSARERTQYKWPIIAEGDVYKTAVIAVHPHLVQYDIERGFRFALSNGTHTSPLSKKKKNWERYSYRRETYDEHVAGLFAAYQHGRSQHKPLKDEIAYVVNRLENHHPQFQLSPGQIDQMLRAMFACHDLGKLDVKWQKWAYNWQNGEAHRFYGADALVPSHYMAAHTDYNPNDKAQREAQKKIQTKRPNHAGESAIAAASLFDKLCGESDALYKAGMTAVFRHHTPTASSYESYKLHSAALSAIQAALEAVACTASWIDHIEVQMVAGEPLGDVLIEFDNRHLPETLLYFLLVRVLRLADQRSQSV
ncbi:MAG: CRISPR-associated helicase Cas3' [Anaerolineaceae bacterium]|nr:CRISPR-associated helicase Cas3' [Anaerolineaceae bacterium]